MRVKNTLVLGLLLVFGLALPNLALANPFAGALAGVFATLFGLISNILGSITGAFLGLAVMIFNWVTSSSFIALLINFTPVILGLVVDAANIAMNFFVQGGFGGGNSFANYATSQWGNIGSLVGGVRFWDPTANQEAIAAAVGSFVLIFFNLIAGLIYLLFAFIFIIRYIAIWTLVILSPFAFACYIFPATKKVFTQWWQAFLQWSLIGVIAAFFLYLGDHFIRTATQEKFLATSMGEITNASGLAPIINSIMPYFVAITFLFIGLIMSLTFAPKGADAIIKGGQRGINKASQIYRKKAWGATKAIGRAATAPPRGFAQGMKAGGGWKTRGRSEEQTSELQ